MKSRKSPKKPKNKKLDPYAVLTNLKDGELVVDEKEMTITVSNRVAKALALMHGEKSNSPRKIDAAAQKQIIEAITLACQRWEEEYNSLKWHQKLKHNLKNLGARLCRKLKRK